MIRLDGDRHRRVRDAFGGLFTARRAGRYRAIIAERAAALIDQAAPAGSMDLVAGFARPPQVASFGGRGADNDIAGPRRHWPTELPEMRFPLFEWCAIPILRGSLSIASHQQ